MMFMLFNSMKDLSVPEIMKQFHERQKGGPSHLLCIHPGVQRRSKTGRNPLKTTTVHLFQVAKIN